MTCRSWIYRIRALEVSTFEHKWRCTYIMYVPHIPELYSSDIYGLYPSMDETLGMFMTMPNQVVHKNIGTWQEHVYREGSQGSLLTLLLPWLVSFPPFLLLSLSLSFHLISSHIPISSLLITSLSPKVPLCLLWSPKNLLGILFVACKLTWFPTSLFVPTFTQRLHLLFFFRLSSFLFLSCFCFTFNLFQLTTCLP